MKKIITISIFSIILLGASLSLGINHVSAYTAGAFVTTWQTTSPSESITIPTYSGETYDYNVDWGDESTPSSGLSHQEVAK